MRRDITRLFLIAALACLPGSFAVAQQTELPSAPGFGEQPLEFEQTAQQPSTQPQSAQQTPNQQQPPAPQEEKKVEREQTTPPKINAEGQPVAAVKQQPKRILGIMPNYRAVSAGALPTPPTPKQAFIVATQNSFDYSAFIFVGITSLLADATRAHPGIGQNGLPGYAGYYWRGFLDKTTGNYMVVFALPSVLHEDERYYARGEGNGGILKRGVYAATRILITPDYHGKNTFNASEVFGRAIAQGISTTYYPKADRTAGALAVKYGWAMGRDALTNVFREFWPDIAVHVLHRRHP